jgi:hypothetical protein
VKRLVVAASFAMGAMVASALPAAACMTYCDWDPLVAVITPAGHIVPVYDSVWTSSPLDLGLPLESYTVKHVIQAGKTVTQVNVSIYVPAGLLFTFQTFNEVTTGLLGSGTVLASGYGSSGSTTHLQFVIPEP